MGAQLPSSRGSHWRGNPPSLPTLPLFLHFVHPGVYLLVLGALRNLSDSVEVNQWALCWCDLHRQVLGAGKRKLAVHFDGACPGPTNQPEVTAHVLCCCSGLYKTVIVSYYFNLLKNKPQSSSSSITQLRKCLTWIRLSAAIRMMPVAS